MEDEKKEEKPLKKKAMDWILGVLLFGIGMLLIVLWGLSGVRH